VSSSSGAGLTHRTKPRYRRYCQPTHRAPTHTLPLTFHLQFPTRMTGPGKTAVRHMAALGILNRTHAERIRFNPPRYKIFLPACLTERYLSPPATKQVAVLRWRHCSSSPCDCLLWTKHTFFAHELLLLELLATTCPCPGFIPHAACSAFSTIYPPRAHYRAPHTCAQLALRHSPRLHLSRTLRASRTLHSGSRLRQGDAIVLHLSVWTRTAYGLLQPRTTMAAPGSNAAGTFCFRIATTT